MPQEKKSDGVLLCNETVTNKSRSEHCLYNSALETISLCGAGGKREKHGLIWLFITILLLMHKLQRCTRRMICIAHTRSMLLALQTRMRHYNIQRKQAWMLSMNSCCPYFTETRTANLCFCHRCHVVYVSRPRLTGRVSLTVADFLNHAICQTLARFTFKPVLVNITLVHYRTWPAFLLWVEGKSGNPNG